MKDYRKLRVSSLSFDEGQDLAHDDLYNQEEQMRTIFGEILTHAEKIGIREYQIVVYAKSRQ